MVPNQHKEQRVGVFVDVQNMYYSAKNLYAAKVDFSKVLQLAVAGRRLMRAFPSHPQLGFLPFVGRS